MGARIFIACITKCAFIGSVQNIDGELLPSFGVLPAVLWPGVLSAVIFYLLFYMACQLWSFGLSSPSPGVLPSAVLWLGGLFFCQLTLKLKG